MITKEDIQNAEWSITEGADFKECYRRMHLIAQQLLKERDAYREVAIKYGDILDDNRNIRRTATDVDAEAQKLLSKPVEK